MRAAFFVACLSLGLTACSQTSGIVTGASRPAVSPAKVKVYLEPPAEYEVIGLVTGHSFTGWTQQQDLNKALAKLKEQAAKMGANGVLVESVAGPRDSAGALILGPNGQSATVVPTSPSSEAKLTGKAIWVTREKSASSQ